MDGCRRRTILKLAAASGALGMAPAIAGGQQARTEVTAPDRDPPRAYDDFTVRRVPDEYDSIQAAVIAAEERDLVLVEPGIYHESVTVSDTPRLTIRGRDRNEVILDGEFTRRNGVTATVDGVVVENLTTRHYTYNGVYWVGVDGYRGSYLTAYNNGEYGVYAFDSINGRFDNSYASGHPDSGFYVGQCQPCRAVLENLISEGNSIGYSGTNAGGELVVRDSVWRENMAGIVPNTLDSEALAPQRGVRIENNDVLDNNNENAPTKAIGFPAFGTGINVAGGTDNVVVGNRVRNHANFGVVLVPNIDKNLWRPKGNRIQENRVDRSGRVDVALGAPAGPGNRFVDNDFGSSRPDGIQGRGPLGGLRRAVGDPWVTLLLGKGFLQTEVGDFPSGDWRERPHPPAQPNMSNPDGPPREAVGPSR